MADISNDTATATGTATSRTLASRFADMINVRDDGAAADGTTDDRTAFANADADASGTVIVVPPGTYRLANDITIGSALFMMPGAVLKPDDGVTVTLSKVPSANALTIFDIAPTSTANVVISTSATGTVNVLWWGPAGDGTTDDAKALQGAFDAAENKCLVFPFAVTYSIQSPVSFAANTTVRNCNATLQIDYSDSSLTTAVSCGANFKADLIKVTVSTGQQITRGVRLNADSSVERIEVLSVDQQANTSGDRRHAALRINDANCRIGLAVVENFDYGIVVSSAEHCIFGSVDMSSYVRGIFVDSSDHFTLQSGAVYGQSPNAAFGAGENGLLFELSNYVAVSNLIVEDAAEHGIRVGGIGDVEGYSFANVQIVRSRKNGLKINVRNDEPPADHIASQIVINGLTVVDCAYGNAPGSNEDGLHLECVNFATINGVQIETSDPVNRVAADTGIYMMGCSFIIINGVRITNVANYGVQISDSVPGGGQPHTVPIGQIYLNSAVIIGTGSDGIHIDSATELLRDIVVSDCYIRGYGASGTSYGVNIFIQASGATQPCVFHGWIDSASGGTYQTNNADADLHNYITSV